MMLATFRSEWGKVWSIRSPLLCLTGAALLVVVTAMTLANDFVHGMRIGEVDPQATMPAIDAAAPAVFTGLVVFAAFAMLPMTSEYSSGTIRSTFQAQPRRQIVLACKAAITAVAGLAAGALTGWLALVASELVLGVHAAATAGGMVAAIVRIALALMAAAVLVVGLAAIIRHAVGTLAAAFVLLAGTLALPERVAVWTPAGAVSEYMSGSVAHYPTAAGLLVVAGWAVVAYGLGALLLDRRDASS